MDITEPFRNEDITKTDFFDFVITPELSDSNHQFSKHIRASSAYLNVGNDIIIKQELNNNEEDSSVTAVQVTTASVSNTSNSTPTSTTTNLSNYDSSQYWNCDKDTIKLESSILDDLNKYYWQNDEHDTSSSTSTKALYNTTGNNSSTNNTDGHIYTLTVLNGIDQSTWYRQSVPVTSTMLIKHEDISLASPVSPSIDNISNSLDIDSILNIIPGHMNGFHHSNDSSQQNDHYLNDNNNNASPNTDDGIVKTETFTYDDSGYADAKDELANTLIIDTPMLEAHDNFNQSTDWKTIPNSSHSDSGDLRNNNNHNQNLSSPDSLLRNALQGKTYIRYNGSQKLYQQYHKIAVSNHTELRKALSSAQAIDSLGNAKNSILLQGTITNKENVLKVFEENNNINNSNDPRSSPQVITATADNSMDDLLFQQLERVSYPEDFEKLKNIANEVAQSVHTYCLIDNGSSLGSSDLAILATNTLITSNSQTSSSPLIQASVPSTITTVVKPSSINRKKKLNGNITKSSINGNLHNNTTISTTTNTVDNSSTSTTSSNSSTSSNNNNNNNNSNNNMRKERSLHYCGICSKGFKDKYSVNVHIRTHTGEKPFACNLCGKSFRQKAHLAKHYQTHIAQKNASNSSSSSSPKSVKANR